MSARRPLADRMVEAARRLEDATTPQATAEAAVRMAVEAVPGCSAAGITQVERRGRLSTAAYSAELVLAGDLLQYELGEGPCVDAVWEQQYVHCADLARDERWPAWAPRMAREHGVRSMLCLRLFTHSDTLGALNLYSLHPDAFDAHDRDEGIALAAHVALAITAAERVDQMHQALDTRTTIAQACGILMERFDLDGDAAFRVLARLSSESQTRLRDVARELVETRRLPATPEADAG